METPPDPSRVPNPENPEKHHSLKHSSPKKSAAGIPAVLSSAAHILSEMNIARGVKAMLALNQKEGYDCPGCAWPDPDDERSRLGEYCENGAKAIAEEATTKKLEASFFAKHSVAKLAGLNDYEIGKSGRVAEPMYLAPGATHYAPISWDDAFRKVATHLQALDSPDEAVFYTSGRTSNEAAFLYQLFVREFGTNNLPDCSNMCHESSGVALTESLGIGKGSVTLDDFYKAEVILILGQNPGTNHPRMLSALQKAKENGCRIISVNPLAETGLIAFNDPQTLRGILGIKAALTDIHLQVKINGDLALLQAIEYMLLGEEKENRGQVLDLDFIDAHTTGFNAFAHHINACNFRQLLDTCGVPFALIREAVDLLKQKNKIIACWAMGLTQHKNAVDTIQEVVNLLLMKGSIGKPGAGTCPVRGHSNVQGDRTMGIYEKPSKDFLASLENAFGFMPPQHDGYDTVESIHAMHEGKAKVFVAMGGNFLSATPDTTYTAEALRRCALTVQISTKLNRSHLITGREALIMPTYGRSDRDVQNGAEQFVTTENSMGVVQMSKGNLTPISKSLRSEPAIVCGLAKAALGNNAKGRWDLYLEHYDHIRDDIEKAIPGFRDYNIRVRKLGGFYLPNSTRENKYNTLSGRAAFHVAKVSSPALAADEYLMMTIRSHDQFNTTIYGLNDRYRGVHNERRVIFMNENDMEKSGLKRHDHVDIINETGGVLRTARKFIVIPYNIPARCTATYYPETNVLVPIDSVADKSNTPVSKSVVVKVRKTAR